MLVGVTSKTLLGLKSRKHVFDLVRTFGNVARLTAILCMSTDESKTRFFLVIKFLNGLPTFGDVTGRAIFPFELRRDEEMDVILRVTADTVSAFFPEELWLRLPDHLLCSFFGMATDAIRFLVSSV